MSKVNLAVFTYGTVSYGFLPTPQNKSQFIMNNFMITPSTADDSDTQEHVGTHICSVIYVWAALNPKSLIFMSK